MSGVTGLSKERLDRVHTVLAGHVERGGVPGLVAAVARDGDEHVEVLGRIGADGGAPMRRDTLFRIASMSKPVTAVAALTLVEECVLRLDDPVDDLLPELADRRVLRRPDGDLDDTEPAVRPITLRDLLTFRLGYGLVMLPPSAPIAGAMADRGINVQPPRADCPAPDEYLRRLGELPLLHQPGAGWLYHTGSAVLGVLLSRACGKPLGEVLRERVLEPLGMRDTGFVVLADQLHRLPVEYMRDPGSGRLVPYDDPADSAWAREPDFPDGGGDLVSTVDDYLAFARMLLGGGSHGGVRILSRPTVELMTANQLTPAQLASAAPLLGRDDLTGWGFGVSVTTTRTGLAAPGRYGWDGGLGTSWFNDPAERLVGILLTQRMFESAAPPQVVQDFEVLAHQAVAG
ncbi:serine hydrolase [Kitasatospora aureofaciens]|uniref:serine hydrolase domain-containing protein n=1 Tax=Kitasatospora aureofaciens TaxID=1894 RepID=UPI001C4609B2|nr:serine hydrolase domain-containing protein [Kitasatospora aureofaciens]MBV6700578.1 beta-lactamase family protein [Kitasatospora aureofaciens]